MSTMGYDEEAIRAHIRNQEKEDQGLDHSTFGDDAAFRRQHFASALRERPQF